ncbi:hypothetical protein BOX15_Mlig017691g3 [Macrostomum lignano]|uniref:Uncharacterized protein n=1 Tax=Macrostomum lignano TaxID=282301 RepID=A0A267FPZ8_9PLAT|nr:hypothetical protein BOX15_Mlig017691g3 [Macrostomum lignano]
MAWISYGGRSGATILDKRRSRYADNTSNSDDGGAVGSDDPPRYKGVPLCGAGLCSGPGLPPKRLPRPGIDCVNGDRPCLPCDIVNVRLRVAVAGSKVKRAVAECQRRYFCRVWNLLFAYLFPGEHRDGPCNPRVVRPNDPMPVCRGQPQTSQWRQRQKQSQPRPVWERALSPVEDMKMTDHRVRRRLPDEQKQPPASTPPPPPPPPPTAKKRPAVQTRRQAGNLRYNLVDRPYLTGDSLKSHQIRGATPARNGQLRGNFYDLPAMDSEKRA